MNTSFMAAMLMALGLNLASPAVAATPTVEIIAMPHPPVTMALAPLRAWLGSQGKNLTVVETDAESAKGVQRLESVGLRGHIPIVILIDGRYRQKFKDGRQVELVNFPNINGTPPAVRGQWTTADVQAVLAGRVK